jgi:hypothetical protein
MWRHHPQENQFSAAFWRIFFLKNREYATEYSVIRRLCRYLAIFRPKKSLCATSIVTKGEELSTSISKSCVLVYIYCTCQSTLSNTVIQQGRNEGGKSKGHMSYPA